LELAHEAALSNTKAGVVRAVGWDWAGRCMDLQLCEGSLVDLAYRIRENDHPDFGGIEVEIAGVRKAATEGPGTTS
jgi:dTDP-4-dehydrorhamnose 3,5-epimerase-like enzyme